MLGISACKTTDHVCLWSHLNKQTVLDWVSWAYQRVKRHAVLLTAVVISRIVVLLTYWFTGHFAGELRLASFHLVAER